MDLRSDLPYWIMRHGIIQSYPSLDRDTRSEVVVIGGGISGALTAWTLQDNGYSVMLVDRRHIGMGSTAANTGLLQYETDTPLVKLRQLIGIQKATRAYLLCLDSIRALQEICIKAAARELYQPRPSFQYASYKKDKPGLLEEFQYRQQAGIAVEWLDERAVHQHFGFHKSGGILSADGAVIDAYALTHALLRDGIRKGMKVYDHTEIRKIDTGGSIRLTTASGNVIKAKKLVIACGYESQRYIPKKIQFLRSTYAIISEPLRTGEPWYRNAMIWETNENYLYIRTTEDRRIIVGGKDIPSADHLKRDVLLRQKAKDLQRSFLTLFPGIEFKTDFRWAGSFAATRDSLPYIGCIPGLPNILFSLGLGGNGTVFSVIAARIILQILQQKKRSADQELFAFDR